MDVGQLQASAQQPLPAGQPGQHSGFTQALIGGIEINKQCLQRVADRKQDTEVEGTEVLTEMKEFILVIYFFNYLSGCWRCG